MTHPTLKTPLPLEEILLNRRTINRFSGWKCMNFNHHCRDPCCYKPNNSVDYTTRSCGILTTSNECAHYSQGYIKYDRRPKASFPLIFMLPPSGREFSYGMPITMIADLQTRASTYVDNAMSLAFPINCTQHQDPLLETLFEWHKYREGYGIFLQVCHS